MRASRNWRSVCEIYSIRQRLKVLSLSHETKVIVDPDLFLVPFERKGHIVGREELLENLREYLFSPVQSGNSRTVILRGRGGVGKSEIAIEYAHRNRNLYKHTYWLIGTSKETFIGGLNAIGVKTGCEMGESGQLAWDTAKIVLSWLQQQGNWLLVLDGLRNDSVVEGYLPRSGPNQHILITTENSISILGKQLDIPVLSQGSAIDLLQMRSGLSIEEILSTASSELVSKLDYLPLSIEHAATYIRKTSKSLRGYLSLFQQTCKEISEHESLFHPETPASVAATIMLINKMMEMEMGREAGKLLTLISFLNVDRIEKSFLLSGYEGLSADVRSIFEEETTFLNCLKLLQEYSLIQKSLEEDIIVVHRVVQRVVKGQLSETERSKWDDEITSLTMTNCNKITEIHMQLLDMNLGLILNEL